MAKSSQRNLSLQKALSGTNNGGLSGKHSEGSQECLKKDEAHTMQSIREFLLYLNMKSSMDDDLSERIALDNFIHPVAEDMISRWYELHSLLTTDEFNYVFSSLDDQKYHPGQLVYRQGDRNDNLYFVHGGILKLVCTCDSREILLQTITCGHISGEDSFFTTTLNVVSLVALSEATLGILTRETLVKARNDFPSLEQKLYDYAKRHKSVGELVKERQLDRRTTERYPFFTHGIVSLFDPSGEWSRKGSYARLSDISRGGLAFLARLPRREAARELLGQKLKIFPRVARDKNLGPDLTGTVVSVTLLTYHECTVHVKFDRTLLPGELEEIIA